MNTAPNTVPRIAIQSIGGGLFLMAFFTLMWNGIAESGFQGTDHYLTTVIFSIFSLAFISYGIYLFSIAKRFRKLSTDAEKSEGKRIGKSFGIIFGIEGVAIPVVVFILIAVHSGKFIIPAIALIVGLHFYPMAKVFKRKIDYYIGTWTCIIAIAGIVMTMMDAVSQSVVFSFVGIGVGLATTAYGIFMLYTAYRYNLQSP